MKSKIPGFTAQVSLFDVRAQYDAVAEPFSYDDTVQPAASDVFVLRDPGISAGVRRRRTVLDPCFVRRRCQNIYDPRPELRGKVLFTHCWIERVCP